MAHMNQMVPLYVHMKYIGALSRNKNGREEVDENYPSCIACVAAFYFIFTHCMDDGIHAY